MLRVTNLTKDFKTAGGVVHAIRSVNFSIADTAFAAIIGKSGSGKSTLLSLLGALDKADSGIIEVAGKDVSSIRGRALTRYRGRTIGFIFQQFNLIPNLTALENVMLPMEFAGVRSGERRARAAALLDQVGIGGSKQSRRPNRLSGGEQQRVAIARALANRPAIILADEPTGNLDSDTGEHIIALLQDLVRKEGVTVIVVTHDMNIAKQCDQIVRLVDGQVAL